MGTRLTPHSSSKGSNFVRSRDNAELERFFGEQANSAWLERGVDENQAYLDSLDPVDDSHVVPETDWIDDDLLEAADPGTPLTPTQLALNEFVEATEQGRLCAPDAYDFLFYKGMLDDIGDGK